MKQIKLVRKIMVRPAKRSKIAGIIRSTLRNRDHMMNLNVAFLRTPSSARMKMSALPAITSVNRMLLCGGQSLSKDRVSFFNFNANFRLCNYAIGFCVSLIGFRLCTADRFVSTIDLFIITIKFCVSPIRLGDGINAGKTLLICERGNVSHFTRLFPLRC